ncbi:MAG: hypothetical protein ACREUQ_03780, partial [Burkholderiales bacterium]
MSAKLRTIRNTGARLIVSRGRVALPFAAIAIMTAALVSVGDLSSMTNVALAQIGGVPAAPPAPVAPPPPVQALPQGALPQLLAAPESTSILLASPSATPRVFRCTCSGPGVGAQWLGKV